MTAAAPAPAPGSIEVAPHGPTFLDPEQERSFTERGYATMDLLSPEDVERIRSWYRATRPADDDGLEIDYIRPDRDMMRKVAAFTEPIWPALIDQRFVDHRCAFTTFVTKHPGDRSDMFLHEDRSFVDERLSRAGTLWIPLVDVGPDLPNGGLQLVPGSMRLARVFSGSNTPELFRPFEAELREQLIVPELKAGQAVFYDTRTLHASPANRSHEPREAVACAIVRRSAPLIHVVASGRRGRQLYHVGADFFVECHPRDIEVAMPASSVLVETWNEDPDLPLDVVAELIGREIPPPVVEIPWDLTEAPRSGKVTVSPASKLPPIDHDLGVAASDLPALGEVRSRHVHHLLDGQIGLIALSSKEAMASAAPAVAEISKLAVRLDATETELLVLDPRSRLVVTIDVPVGGWCSIDVVDGPRIGAGAVWGGAADHLDLGVSLHVAEHAEVLMWNDGPTPLALTVSVLDPEGSSTGTQPQR